MFHKATIENVYNVFYFKTLSMCIFNAVKNKSGIGYIVDALFGNLAYLHSLYILIHFVRQPDIEDIASSKYPLCILQILSSSAQCVPGPWRAFKVMNVTFTFFLLDLFYLQVHKVYFTSFMFSWYSGSSIQQISKFLFRKPSRLDKIHSISSHVINV